MTINKEESTNELRYIEERYDGHSFLLYNSFITRVSYEKSDRETRLATRVACEICACTRGM